MDILEKLITAAKFQIVEGSVYEWRSFGPNARWLDCASKEFEGVELSIVFDAQTQEVYQSMLYLPGGKAYRWTSPVHEKACLQEHFDKDIDPRVAYDCVYFYDCEVLEDFIEKVAQSFETGVCDTTILINLDISDDLQEFIDAQPEGFSLDKLVAEVLTAEIQKETQKNENLWKKVQQELSSKSIDVGVENPKAYINEKVVTDLIDWVLSYSPQSVYLEYCDKLTQNGLIATVTDSESGNAWSYAVKA